MLGTDEVSYSQQCPDQVIWPQLRGVSRHFTRISQAADENGMSRIYGGIHFSFDNTAGLQVGADVANNVYNNFLTPVPEPGSAVSIALAATAFGLRRRRSA